MEKNEAPDALDALRVVLESPVAVAIDQAMSLPAGDAYTVGMSRILASLLADAA